MKKIVTSRSAIENVLNGKCVYVDKTAYMHKLITAEDNLFFISRPRRFGKSLMLSTLKAIFEGRRELFEGTAISKLDYDWQEYPVLYFDMSDAVGKSVDAVLDGLNTLAMSAAGQLGLDVKRNDDPAQTFLNFWNAVSEKKKQVVVLVDEYDVPLQGFLRDREKLEVLRKAMHDFYVKFKSKSGSIKFLMMTGVTKLTKLSVFSGLNNPIDLTMDPEYAGMLGYTREELEANFSDHIDAFAAKQNVTREVLIDKLLEWYDNYRFSPESDVKVVNPVSVGLSLSKCAFKNFWMSTGKSSIVIEHLRAAGNLPSDLDHMSAFEEELDVCDAVTMPIKSFLYQSGYLTIDGVSEDGELFLRVPNTEIRQSIVYGYLATEINDVTPVHRNQLKAIRLLREGKISEAVDAFNAAIASLPYEWVTKGKESAVKSAFAMFFYAMYKTRVTYEHQSLNGRSDAVVETNDAVYVFEFKYGHTAQEAFDQILNNRYYESYLASGKPIYGIGLNFNPTEGSRGIDEPVVELIRNSEFKCINL